MGKNKFEILLPDGIYHVYNRANGTDKIFLSNENYRYFLENTMNISAQLQKHFAIAYYQTIFIFL